MWNFVGKEKKTTIVIGIGERCVRKKGMHTETEAQRRGKSPQKSTKYICERHLHAKYIKIGNFYYVVHPLSSVWHQDAQHSFSSAFIKS